MKKVLVLLLTLTLTLSMSLSAVGAADKTNNGKGKGANKSEIQTAAELSDKAFLKQFKMEMNQYVKNPVAALQSDLDALILAQMELQGEIYELNLDRTLLDPASLEYAVALDNINADIAAKVSEMANLDGQIAAVNTQLAIDPESLKKQFINERFMVIKSEKSGFDLSSFNTAEALIAAMYTAAQDEGQWSFWVNNSENLVKLEGPMYLKGSKIMFPLQAMRDLGAEVTWDETAKTVTVLGANGVSMVFAPGGKTATTQASVADGAVIFTDGSTLGEKVGTISGTLIDPVTGVVYNVEASATLALQVDPDTALFTDGIVPQTITANIVDQADSSIIIKTVELEVSGTLSDPSLSFGDVTLDVEIADTTIMNCGRAYHPLNDLVDIFALEATADLDAGVLTVTPEEPIELI